MPSELMQIPKKASFLAQTNWLRIGWYCWFTIRASKWNIQADYSSRTLTGNMLHARKENEKLLKKSSKAI